MQNFIEILTSVYKVLLYPTLFFGCYYAFLALVGLFSGKEKYPIVKDKLRFCIFVPCHNEQTVIAATVKNHAKINYDPSLYDIYFIADNCTDKTAYEIKKTVRSLGMSNLYCLERNVSDPAKKGKPHAMNWGIERLEARGHFYDTYDMFMILDADNFIDSDILKHINSQYLAAREGKRPVMIQTYLDSKNKNSLIARGYFASYRVTGAFFQKPKHVLGLVPAIGGTGFAMTTDFLRRIGGYHCTSLTEDLEIQTVATLKGERIAYNHNVRIYDEKPTGLKQSAVQRTRWAQGHWFVFFKFGWRLFLHILNPKEIRFFLRRLDNLIYLSTMLFMLMSVLCGALSVTLMLLGVSVAFLPMYITAGVSVIMLLLFPLSSLLDGPPDEKKSVLVEFIPNLLASLIVGAIFSCYSNVAGLLHCKNQSVWRKTAHNVTKIQTRKEKPVENRAA